MKNKKFTPLLSFFSVMLMFSCRQIVAPEYIGIENLQLGASSFTNTTLSADVRLYNPNKSNLVFKSGSLDIFIDNRKLGHTELDSTINIPRQDTFSIPLVVKLDLVNVIGNALSMGLKDSVIVKLTGKVKVGRSGVFITKPVNYEQKEKLDLF
ncbi:MAG: LEA type 2 family protein [Bacteroidetes bacterium]|nr:LEA type 2 family protein [Bacteroidota bacterium]